MHYTDHQTNTRQSEFQPRKSANIQIHLISPKAMYVDHWSKPQRNAIIKIEILESRGFRGWIIVPLVVQWFRFLISMNFTVITNSIFLVEKGACSIGNPVWFRPSCLKMTSNPSLQDDNHSGNEWFSNGEQVSCSVSNAKRILVHFTRFVVSTLCPNLSPLTRTWFGTSFLCLQSDIEAFECFFFSNSKLWKAMCLE